jgi:hypothetical protein
MGDPGAVVLLGLHVTERLAEIGQHRENGVVSAVERDRVLKLVTVVIQLERGQRGQGVLRLVYTWRSRCGYAFRLGFGSRHRSLFPNRHPDDVS